MILRTVRALISLTVRAACKITTSNKPAKSHRDKSKQTNSSKVLQFYWKHSFLPPFIIAPMCIVRVKKIRNNTHSEDG